MPNKQEDFLKKKYVDEYVDPMTGVTGKQLKLGYWWITHKSAFARVIVVLLILLDLSLVGFSSFKWGIYLFRGIEQEELLMQELSQSNVTNEGWRLAHKPKNLNVLSNSVFTGRGDKYDLVAELVNPNERWIIFFDYRFSFNGGETPWRTSFLLPSESGIKTELGFDWDRRPRNAQLEIQNLKWLRLTAHVVKDVGKFISDNLEFIVREATVSQPAGAGDVGNILQFTIRNNTPSSFRRVPMYIGLYRGSRLAAVEYAIVEPFKSGQEMQLEIATTLTGGNISEVKVFPELNVFDKSVFLPPES
jgi:hypothetical protein